MTTETKSCSIADLGQEVKSSRRKGHRGGNKKAQKERKKLALAKARENGESLPQRQHHGDRTAQRTRRREKAEKEKEERQEARERKNKLFAEYQERDPVEGFDKAFCKDHRYDFVKTVVYMSKGKTVAGIPCDAQLLDHMRCMLTHWIETQETSYRSTYDDGMHLFFARETLAMNRETKVSGFYNCVSGGGRQCRRLAELGSHPAFEFKESKEPTESFNSLSPAELTTLFFYMSQSNYLDHEYATALPARFKKAMDVLMLLKKVDRIESLLSYKCFMTLVQYNTTAQDLAKLKDLLKLFQNDERLKRSANKYVRGFVEHDIVGELRGCMFDLCRYPLDSSTLNKLKELVEEFESGRTVYARHPLFKPLSSIEEDKMHYSYNEVYGELEMRSIINGKCQGFAYDIYSRGVDSRDPNYSKARDVLVPMLKDWTVMSLAHGASTSAEWFKQLKPEYANKLKVLEEAWA